MLCMYKSNYDGRGDCACSMSCIYSSWVGLDHVLMMIFINTLQGSICHHSCAQLYVIYRCVMQGSMHCSSSSPSCQTQLDWHFCMLSPVQTCTCSYANWTLYNSAADDYILVAGAGNTPNIYMCHLISNLMFLEFFTSMTSCLSLYRNSTSSGGPRILDLWFQWSTAQCISLQHCISLWEYAHLLSHPVRLDTSLWVS